jgi:hypothetical protein
MPTPNTWLDAVPAPDGRIYVTGGTEPVLNTVQIYDPVGHTWTTGAPIPNPRSFAGTALGGDGRMYTFGGSTVILDNNDSVEAYTLPNWLAVTAPSTEITGTPLTITVTAKDPTGAKRTGFTDTVHLRSSDPAATLPPDYTFRSSDGGTHTFTVTLRTEGAQSITVSDNADRLNSGSVKVRVGVAAAPGWNLLDSPDEIPYTPILASTLVHGLFSTDGHRITIGALATYKEGVFSVYLPGYSADRVIHAEDGILAQTSQAGIWSPDGAAAQSALPIALSAGWNLVAAPYPEADQQARAIATAASSCNVRAIATEVNGSYQTWTPAQGGVLAIPSTSGLWIECGQTGTWTPGTG